MDLCCNGLPYDKLSGLNYETDPKCKIYLCCHIVIVEHKDTKNGIHGATVSLITFTSK